MHYLDLLGKAGSRSDTAGLGPFEGINERRFADIGHSDDTDGDGRFTLDFGFVTPR